MAAHKAITWMYLRWLIASAWFLTLLRVSIPDYGYQYSLFENLGYDPTGWLHECFYITVFFLCLITLTYYWEGCNRVYIVRVKRLEKDTERK